jgi:hypothetical protein
MMNIKLKRHFFPMLVVISFSMELNAQQKFSVGLTFSPNYCFRTIQPEHLVSSRLYYKNPEKPIYTYSTGVHLKYAFNRIFAIQSGFNHSEYGTQYHFKKEDLSHNDFFEETLDIKYIHSYNSIPLDLQFTFLRKNNLKVFASIGSAYYFSLNTYEVRTIDGQKEKRQEIVNNSFYGGFAIYNNAIDIQTGIGLVYTTGNFDFSIQPKYRRMITNNVLNRFNYDMKVHYYTLGLEFGIFYKLGKEQKE